MKRTKKFTAIIMVLILIITAATTNCFAAHTNLTFSVRIEGVTSNLFYSDVTISTDENVTVAYALQLIDNASDDLTIIGADSGYISEINGEKAGMFGGWDGWSYTVNGISPDVGVGDYILSDGDTVVLYYGDYPCQLPEIDTTWFAADGTIKFTSTDTIFEYDEETEEWISTTVTSPVTGMTVTIDGDIQLITDKSGEIKFDFNKYILLGSGANLQISKYNENGAPAICRYAPDFKIAVPTRGCELYGDADLNGSVNIIDAAYIQLYLAKLTGDDITPEQFISADVDVNYAVNIKDAAAIQLALAKLGPQLPII